MVISAHFELQISERCIALATSKAAASIFGDCEVEVMVEAAWHVSCGAVVCFGLCGVVVCCDCCGVVVKQW